MSPPDKQPIARPADRVLNLAENVVYAVAGGLLAVSAALALAVAGYHLVRDLDEGVKEAIAGTLDGLLLVFILLELLAAVRATMTERKLVAEPFLVAAIIASIKEIIVLSLSAKDDKGAGGAAFDDTMTEIGVLAGVVLVLAVATYLVRRKEREPEEQTDANADADASPTS